MATLSEQIRKANGCLSDGEIRRVRVDVPVIPYVEDPLVTAALTLRFKLAQLSDAKIKEKNFGKNES